MGFNLVNKKKSINKVENSLKNVSALNNNLTKNGEHKNSSNGFDLSFTAEKTYNLDEIEENKNRQSTISPLVVEVSDEKTAKNAGLVIGSKNNEKIVPKIDDYKKYLLDD